MKTLDYASRYFCANDQRNHCAHIDLRRPSETSGVFSESVWKYKGLEFFLPILLALLLFFGHVPSAFSQSYNLTAAVLVNSTNSAGYSPEASNPGEFQRYPERYLEHLQVPYQVFDVSSAAPPADLGSRQLILVGHKNVNLSSAWQSAIISAVASGTGLVNLDGAQDIGSRLHMQTIFGASGSSIGSPGTSIRVPASVAAGGADAHFITALQTHLVAESAGQDFVYQFHEDFNGVVQPSAATVLQNATGRTLAYLGSSALIQATNYLAGRAVHFGTLEYLKADRFGFLMGVDDLFWRSLVWAARKPFVVRGYPRFWAVQMDDTESGWGLRVRDMFNQSLTGAMAADGSGGPWKVTGFVFTNNLSPGSSERASVVSDIASGRLQISPHGFGSVTYGDMYWNSTSGQLTDQQWLNNLSGIESWKAGLNAADSIPSISRSWVGHYWNISDNTGFDAWNTLNFRYLTSIIKPGYQLPITGNGGAEKLNARPFWLYETPPNLYSNGDLNYPAFFADDLVVNSRAGQSSKTFFLFASQWQDLDRYPLNDLVWPNGYSSNQTVQDTVEQFKQYTWRFWSSMAPVQIYTHDSLNFAYCSPCRPAGSRPPSLRLAWRRWRQTCFHGKPWRLPLRPLQIGPDKRRSERQPASI